MTPAEKAKCDEWLSKRAKNWQTAKRAQWKYQWRGKTLVRFLDNVSMREIEDGLVLEYLCSDDCKAKLSLYSQVVDSSWTPVSAWYEAMTNRQQVQGVFPVRLYHALKKDVDTGADGAYVVEDGCAYKVEFTFYWHQASVQTVPKSTSGVHYRIAGINRDEEDGTYNYTLEKRTRVQQDIAQYTSAENMEKRVRREEHFGVKGDVGEGGLAAGCDGAGTTTTRQVSKNDDCTHNVSNSIEKDKPVIKKVTERSRGLRGTVISETSINQSAPLDDSDLSVGQSVRNEKTASGLWNTVKRFVNFVTGGTVLHDACDKTVYRHTHSKTTAVGEDPGFSHVEEAAGGIVKSADVRKTEEGWDVTISERTDKPVSESSKSVSRRIGSIVTTTHNKAQEAPAPSSGIKVGEEVRNDKTDSGVYDQTIVSAQAVDTPLADDSCDKTRHVHAHSRTDFFKDDPGRANADEVSNGTVHSVRVRKTDAGGFSVTEETKTAKPSVAISTSDSEAATHTRTNLRNAESVADLAPSKDVNRTVETSVQVNEFALEDGAVSVTDYHPMQRTVQNETRFIKRKVTVKENEATDQEPSFTFQKGRLFQTSSNPNGHGSSSVRIEEDIPKPWTWSQVFTNNNFMAGRTVVTRHKIVLFRNLDDPPDIEDGWDSVRPSARLNDFELWDGSYEYSQVVKDVLDKNGGRGGEQFDKRAQVFFEWDKSVRNEEEGDGEDKKKVEYLYYRYSKVQKRILYSTFHNMMAEIIKHPGYPDIGPSCVSRMENGCAVIFEDRVDILGAFGDGGKYQRRRVSGNAN